MDIVNPALDDYLLAHCTPADDVLRDLVEETHALVPGTSMQITHDEGEFLTLLVRLAAAARGAGQGTVTAVEVGVFTGYSSICIARGLPPEGRLLACDVSEEWTAVARRYWQRAGLTDRIDLRLAPAAETLRALPRDEFVDFAFIDADKTGYPAYYDELVPRLRPGGLLVLDNVLRAGRVVDPAAQEEADIAVRHTNDMVTADDRMQSVMLPLRDGVTLARKRP